MSPFWWVVTFGIQLGIAWLLVEALIEAGIL